MRTSFIISSSAHGVLLLAAVIGLPTPDAFNIDEKMPIPVEILTIDEFTQLTSKVPEIKPDIKPEPAPTPAPIGEMKPDPKPEPEQVVALEPDLVRKPKSEIQLAVETAPTLDELLLENESEPEPVTRQELEPKPTAPSVREIEEPTIRKPRRKPTPPALHTVAREKPKEEKLKLDVDRISALLNKLPDEASNAMAPESPAEGTPKTNLNLAGLDQSLTLSETKYLQRQIERCWSPPVGVAGAETLTVKVQMNLRRDGSLLRPPILLNSGTGSFQIAAEAALRATTQCQPYNLPGDKYDAWREVLFNFDPRSMLGG
jgi:hypothetical protein